MSEELSPQEYNPEEVLDQVLNQKDEELMPWEIVVLPSEGLYYDGQIPNGKVEARPMGLYADKVLTTQRLVKTGQAIDYIFKHCVKLPDDFDQLELLASDRIFLLYYLRGITHGNDYEFILQCPYCDQKSQHEYDLNDLWETKQGPPVDEDGIPLQEPFKVTLPYLTERTGQEFWVKVRFMRGRDSMDMLGANLSKVDGLPRKARNRKKRGKHAYDPIRERSEDLDETLEKNINRVIVEAMGSDDRGKIKRLVDNMHSRDIAAITDFLKDNSPGIDTAIETDCPSCSAIISAPLPITETFFRPEGRRRTRE